MAEYCLTEAGYNALQDRLHHLKEIQWEQAKNNVEKGRAFCDFNEDPDYKNKVMDLAELKEQIDDLEKTLKQAKVMTNMERQNVEIGANVTVKDVTRKEKMIFTVGHSIEASLFDDYISAESPVGKALLGKQIHDKVKVNTPSGPMHLEILSID